MDTEIEKLFKMPHNQLRKAACIKQCLNNLEGLQRQYRPIFDEDPFINDILEQLRTEHERVWEPLRQEKDGDALFRAAFNED
ncbi:MAG: hypothetical protein IKB86_07080 [Clostridia bacterium]|nr:hypothetical protein [Clostridia bacterium]